MSAPRKENSGCILCDGECTCDASPSTVKPIKKATAVPTIRGAEYAAESATRRGVTSAGPTVRQRPTLTLPSARAASMPTPSRTPPPPSKPPAKPRLDSVHASGDHVLEAALRNLLPIMDADERAHYPTLALPPTREVELAQAKMLLSYRKEERGKP